MVMKRMKGERNLNHVRLRQPEDTQKLRGTELQRTMCMYSWLSRCPVRELLSEDNGKKQTQK